MLTLLDRSLIRSYVKSYLICLVSIISLYIIVDLFTNLEDFSQGRKGLGEIVHAIGVYYSYKVMEVFDQLCEGIILVAAMFTVAWVQRNNELLPVLSAGVSTRRMVRPVLLSAFAMLTLAVANQEFVLPNVDSFVIDNKQNMDGKKDVLVNGGYASDGMHITGKRANRSLQTVFDFLCVIPDRANQQSITRLEAKEARYVPAGDGPRSGGWLLTDTRPPTLENWTRTDVLEPILRGKFFLYTSEVDFEDLIRQKNWWRFMSTPRLYDEMNRPGNSKLASLAVLFHMRLTRPLLGLLLVFLGLSTILRDQNRHVFISAGLCLILCAVFFLTSFFCKHLGDHEYFAPALSAWLPVIIFGPLSFVMFDAIHT